jgi:heat shock protein HslJ
MPSKRLLLVLFIGAAVAAACATQPLPSSIGSSGPAPSVIPSAAPTPSSSPSALSSPLAGTAWQAVRVTGRAPVPGKEPTAIFSMDGITGTGGCNDYDGPYRDANGVFSFPKFVSTAVGCGGEISETEDLFYAAMRGATSTSIDAGGQLVIDGPGGSLTFVAAPRPSPS